MGVADRRLGHKLKQVDVERRRLESEYSQIWDERIAIGNQRASLLREVLARDEWYGTILAPSKADAGAHGTHEQGGGDMDRNVGGLVKKEESPGASA